MNSIKTYITPSKKAVFARLMSAVSVFLYTFVMVGSVTYAQSATTTPTPTVKTSQNQSTTTTDSGDITTPTVQSPYEDCGTNGSKVDLSVSVGNQSSICYDKCKLSGNSETLLDKTKGALGATNNGSVDPGCQDITTNPIFQYLVIVINVLSAGVGLVVTGMIVFRGLQYSWSRDNAQATAAAKDGIRDAVIALLLYFFGYALLNYLIPGGLIG